MHFNVLGYKVVVLGLITTISVKPPRLVQILYLQPSYSFVHMKRLEARISPQSSVTEYRHRIFCRRSLGHFLTDSEKKSRNLLAVGVNLSSGLRPGQQRRTSCHSSNVLRYCTVVPGFVSLVFLPSKICTIQQDALIFFSHLG